jgi:hypothetical protein
MAINTNPGSPLRHVATFNSSGNWTAPAGTNVAFISIKSASGGGGGGGGRYNSSDSGNGKSGGAGIVSGAYVQVTPGSSHSVTVGAAGSAGSASSNVNPGGAGGSGGSTIFDSAFTVTGGGGGGQGQAHTPLPAGAQSVSSGTTSLTSLPPSASTLTRVGTISNQNTGATTAGTGGNYTNRYSPKNAGNAGQAATLEIYI